jgi:transcriptional regulator with XRE-family HTH domain
VDKEKQEEGKRAMVSPSLGQRLKRLRLESGHTQDSLATSIGVKLNLIHRYERGIHEPTSGKIIRLCQELNCSADWLLGITPDNQANINLAPQVDLS